MAARIQPSEARAMTFEDHARAFTAYLAGLAADFQRYVESEPADPVRDGADYRVAAMWLTDEEFTDFVRDLQVVFQERLANPPGKGRRRRMIYAVSLPAPEADGPLKPSESG